MVGREDDELLTRIGPGTPMGALFRQYWLPILMSSELPERDGPPMRMRVLGENLIAFRDSGGRVGLLANNCAHRGASLFFGRNEEDGLRCVYHGWKYDVTGACIDMPNEPPESNFKAKIRHVAYPCRELNGAIWTYMGPRQEPPPMPDLEWTQLPESHSAFSKTQRECNWMQALEGDIDNSHISFLHSKLTRVTDSTASRIASAHKAPRIEAVQTDYGVMCGIRREADEEHYNWRISHFLFPSFTIITTGSPQDRGTVPSHMWVPMDDEHTMQWGLKWNPIEPLTSEQRGQVSDYCEYLPDTTDWLGRWRPVSNRANDYRIDREEQKTISFTGIKGFPIQDKVVTESMGAITDRGREHLGSTDTMIILTRQRFVQAAKALQERGAAPPGVETPEAYRVRSTIVNLPKDANWVEATRDVLTALDGSPAFSIA